MELTVDFRYSLPKGADLQACFSIPLDSPRIVVLFGPSGSGKSTLLHCLAGLVQPERGTIRYGESVWFDADRRISLPVQRRSIGLLFQDYPLFPHLTVRDNIAYGLRRWSRAEIDRAVGGWIDRFQLRGKEDRFPKALSGGEQQRVALARALAPRPRLLLLDEPFSALDLRTRAVIRGGVRKWVQEERGVALVVTHDIVDAMTLGEELIILSEGIILQQGPPPEVFSRPASPEVAKIVGVENLLPAQGIDSSEERVILEVGKGRLIAVGNIPPGARCFVSIRAEEVILERGHPVQSSARNRLLGFVQELIPGGAQVRVAIDCGFPLTALVTRQAVEELALRPGAEITAVIKASSVHLIPAE
ncbi:MAG: ABC transporter ATP-binding protein [Candidatus Manganitrophaceae bacterium]|nr:MAG: ABC transporter ATP-binding protein [Candidatus Manganitrophaceae bacterium]